MSVLNDFFNPFFEWISSNLNKIVFSTIAVIIVLVAYKLLTRQITRLREQRKLEENVAFTLKRILQWLSGLVILAVVFAQFGTQSAFSLHASLSFAALLLMTNIIAVFAIILISYTVAILTFKRGLDADNFVIPIESSIADSITSIALLIALSSVD